MVYKCDNDIQRLLEEGGGVLFFFFSFLCFCQCLSVLTWKHTNQHLQVKLVRVGKNVQVSDSDDGGLALEELSGGF